MATAGSRSERDKLVDKVQRLERQYRTQANQGQITKGAFPGLQVPGGTSTLPSQLAHTKKMLEAAIDELAQYDATHPNH